jgi:hypothetical protein
MSTNIQQNLIGNGRTIRGIVGDGVQCPNSAAFPNLGKVNVRFVPDDRTEHDSRVGVSELKASCHLAATLLPTTKRRHV